MKKITTPTEFKTVYLDIMEGARFICQLPFRYCSLWPIDYREISKYIYSKRPSLRGRNIHVEFSDCRI